MYPNGRKTPIIGICVSKEKRDLHRIVTERLKRYPFDVTIITFGMKKLDLVSLKVKGDCFEKKTGKIGHYQGSFPIPNVIYMQCYEDPDLLRRIEKTAGCRVFNNFIFEKGQCWDLLASNKILSCHLPDTQQICNETDLKTFLYRYQDVFIKPINPTEGHSSKGIVRVKIQKVKNIEAIYQKKHKIVLNEFQSFEDFWTSIQLMLSANPHIVQESIGTMKLNEMPTDIRLNMNKNGQGEWTVSALFVRIALNGSHVAAGRGTQYLPIEIKQFLRLAFLNDEMKTVSMIHSIRDLGYLIGQSFDKSGYHMADLGLDLGLDEKGKLWIFEVNPLPFPFGSPVQDDSWAKPLEYAQYLLKKKYDS